MVRPELTEDVVEEILLRLPPDETAALVRASLVCKPWRRIVSDPAFLRRYRRFHPTPPLLGFFNEFCGTAPVPRFVPTTPASPFPQAAFQRRSWAAVDCRHGRVLLRKEFQGNFVVWDPITSGREDLLMPASFRSMSYSASVLCAAAGCDHRDCHGGPFLVVYLGTDERLPVVHACVYSSESATWVTMVSARLRYNCYVPACCGTLIGDAIYQQLLGAGDAILKYDLGKHCLSVIDLPKLHDRGFVLMPSEDGLLGLASASASCLYLWSRKVNEEDGIGAWVQCRVVELQTLLSIDSPCSKRAFLTGFAEGVGVIFVSTEVGTFTVDLKSGKAKKVSEPGHYLFAVPFMTFGTPDACTKLPLLEETMQISYC